MTGDLPTPVTFAMLLKDNGLGLSEAHRAVSELAENGSMIVALRPRDLDHLLAELNKLGLKAHAVTEADVS